MARRMTESGKFRDAWYRNLTPKAKCIWEFMISECNAAGILDIDLKSMSFHIGVGITMNDVKAFDSRLVWIREDKVFIPKFITFQYPGGLNPENRAHKNILPMLKQHMKFDEEQGAWKPLGSPLQGAKEKETVIVTETEQVTVTTTTALVNVNDIDFLDFWNKYPKKTDKKKCVEWWQNNPDKRAAAIKGLEWYAVSKRVKDGFPLDAIRYLKNEVWESDPAAYNMGQSNVQSTFERVMQDISAEEEQNLLGVTHDEGNND